MEKKQEFYQVITNEKYFNNTFDFYSNCLYQKRFNRNKSEKNLFKTIFKEFLILIYPFAPHIASECWEKNFENKEIHTSGWPSYDEKLIKEDKINIVVQINGKKRALLCTEPDQI